MSRRHVSFFAIVLVVVLVWGIVLPRIAMTQTVRERNRWLEERGIDPAAMYYTDLPMMDRVLRRATIGTTECGSYDPNE